MIFLANLACATTYLPIPLEKQLKESSGVIRGKYIGKSYKRLPSGKIVTELSFKVSHSAGVPPRYFVHKSDFKVLVPGGIWQDIVYQVEGAPKFEVNKEVVVLVKKSSMGYWVSNLALGKYSLVRKRGEEFLVSDIFPHHPKLGRVDNIDFEIYVEKRFGEKFAQLNSKENRVFSKIRANSLKKKQKKRYIASEQLEYNEQESKTTSAWLVVFLAILGAVFTIFKRRNF